MILSRLNGRIVVHPCDDPRRMMDRQEVIAAFTAFFLPDVTAAERTAGRRDDAARHDAWLKHVRLLHTGGYVTYAELEALEDDAPPVASGLS